MVSENVFKQSAVSSAARITTTQERVISRRALPYQLNLWNVLQGERTLLYTSSCSLTFGATGFRWQMQLTGSSTSDGFLLARLSAGELGSEASAKKDEVRADKEPPRLSKMRPTVSFYVCYLLLVGLGVACVACVCFWNVRWRGGLAWDGTHLQFNWHPVLMVTGLVVLYGHGAVLYRIPLTWGQNKLPWKLLHAALMLLALVLSIVGLYAVFGVHNAKNIPNVYSLHSWIGIATTALFAMQWVGGVAVFLLPCSPTSLRKLLKPLHVWFGGSILSLGIVACISGINEKLFFALKGDANGTLPYSSLPPEAVFGNSLGVVIVVFGLVVLKMLSNPRWQRPDAAPAETSYSPLLQEEN